MRTIYVKQILGDNIPLRENVSVLTSLCASSEEHTVIDFTGVESASRAFMDEFYKQFADKNAPYAGTTEHTGMNELLAAILGAVSRTQAVMRRKKVPDKNIVHTVATVADLDSAIHSYLN